MQALQFEWAWQHPEKSKAVRDDVTALVASCKRAGLSGAKGKVSGQLCSAQINYLRRADQIAQIWLFLSQNMAHVPAAAHVNRLQVVP